MRAELQELLLCPRCSGALSLQGDGLVCAKCANSFPVKNGRPCFWGTEVNSDHGLQGAEAKTKESWTGWRKKNFEYFKTQFSELPAGLRVLDLGSGPGQFSVLFERFKTFRSDFFPYKECDFLTDINQKLPIADAAFDLVYMSNVLEHVRDPGSLLRECHRILKPGGRIIITVPFFIKIHQAPYDFYRYTSYGLVAQFEQAGFRSPRVDAIGDLFDTFSSVLSGMQKGTLAASKGPMERLLLKILFKFNKISLRLVLKILGVNRARADEKQDYAHGYGVVAIKG